MGMLNIQPFERQRRAIAANVAATFEREGDGLEKYRSPVGDPGFFGPGSVTWRVHADLSSMMVGGLAALMLQTLHPLAMAGVAQHSNYREDSLGRLQRTGEFVGVTTYGSTVEARRAIDIVRRVHVRVAGIAPDGRSYSATDPELLTWVHTAEAACFARAYRRFGPQLLTRAELDRYFAEMAIVAVELGATGVPTTWGQVRQYFRDMQPQLIAGEQALDGLDFIINTRSATPPEEAVRSIFIQAAIGILPAWARDLLAIRPPGSVEGLAVDSAMHALSSLLRWAMGSSDVVAIATARSTQVGSSANAA